MGMSEASVRDLAGWLSAWEWPMPKDRLLTMAGDRDWTLTSDQPKSARWETGLPLGASAVVLDGVVADLTVTTSDDFDDDAAGRRGLKTLFAEQVDTVSQLLGPPARRSPGRSPSATWDLPNGSGLKVEASSGGCYWVLTSPEFVQVESDLGARA